MSKKVSYVDHERRVLVTLVTKYRDIVDNKKTDSSAVHKKQQIWLRITSEYNRHPNVRKRLTQQLKRLWENTKARAKKTNGETISSLVQTTAAADKVSVTKTSASFNDIEESMETNSNSVDVAGFEQMFDHANLIGGGLKGDQDHAQPKRKRRTNDTSSVNIPLDESHFDQFLTPIVSARLKKVEESIEQQSEIHALQVQRERLQIQALQAELSRKIEHHACQLDRERELHDLRIKHEKDIHLQRVRNEQEMHQLKLAEYNKVQTSYPIMYK